MTLKLTRRTLKLQAKPVDFNYPARNQFLANHMVSLMRQEGGVGLAATQIGERVRLFVMEIQGKIWHCFNPIILSSSENWEYFNEGCLSFPGDSCNIQRPAEVMVKYYDAHGTETIETLAGLAARCFQHELDHLNGITMWDRYEEQHAKQPRN